MLSGELRCPDHSVSNDLFSAVTLYFIGKEDVEVRYTESSYGSKGGGPKYKAAKRDIIRTIIPLDTSRNSVMAGRFPFQFYIPAQLPSSMYCKDGNGSYCSIHYKVKLKMKLSRGRSQEVPIEIVAKPPSPVPIPSSVDPMTTRIQMLYCIPQGSMTWAAGVDDTRVGVGEQVTINLGMKNESLAKLERVTAKLKQTVEWHSSGHSSIKKSVIRSSSFEKTDSMKPWSKDQLKVVKCRSRDSRTPPGSQPLTVYEEVLDTVQDGNNRVTFPIPEYVFQSYTGRLIKVHHYVSVKAKTSSCLTNPKVHIPIEIVSPRNTPTVVTAQVIPPPPSAPPMPSNDSSASDALPLNASNLYGIHAPSVAGTGGEEIVVGYAEPIPLAGADEAQPLNDTADPPSRGKGECSPSESPGPHLASDALALDSRSWHIDLDFST